MKAPYTQQQLAILMRDKPADIPGWMQYQQAEILFVLFHNSASSYVELACRLEVSRKWGSLNQSRYSSACRSTNSLIERGLVQSFWGEKSKHVDLTREGIKMVVKMKEHLHARSKLDGQAAKSDHA